MHYLSFSLANEIGNQTKKPPIRISKIQNVYHETVFEADSNYDNEASLPAVILVISKH